MANPNTALLVQAIGISIIMGLAGYGALSPIYFIWSAVALANTLLNIYFLCCSVSLF